MSKDDIPAVFEDSKGRKYRVRYIGSPVDCYFKIEQHNGEEWSELDQFKGKKQVAPHEHKKKSNKEAEKEAKRILETMYDKTVDVVAREDKRGNRQIIA